VCGVSLGRQLHTFNNIAQVYIGGKRDAMGRPLQSFTGTVAGRPIYLIHADLLIVFFYIFFYVKIFLHALL